MSAKAKPQILTISPDRAKAMLGANHHNRNLRQYIVDRYASDMRRGQWLLNGQSIAFDVNGLLLDGQHRLAAISQADVSVEMLVVTGLPVAGPNGVGLTTIDTIDVGVARSIGDQLQLSHGFTNASFRASIARSIAYITTGYEGRLTVYQVLCILKKYGKCVDAVLDARATGREAKGFKRGCIFGPMAFAGYRDLDKATEFAAQVTSGEGLVCGDPAKALRDFVTSCYVSSSRRPTARVHERTMVRYVALAMMHHYEGTKVRSLRLSDIGIDYFVDQQQHNQRELCKLILPECD